MTAGQPHPGEATPILAAPAAGIEPLLALARRRTHLLDGTVGRWSAGYVGGQAGETQDIMTLYRATAETYPEAGPAYWATRSWSMLVWQPCVLAVLAVECLGSSVPVDRLVQRVDGTLVAGFRLPDEMTAVADRNRLRSETGAALKRLCDGLYGALTAATTLKRVNAERLLADRLLGVLSLLPRPTGRLAADETIGLGRQWLAATSLEDQSALVLDEAEDGSVETVLKRRTCCLHYRIEPDNLCATCPKLIQRDKRRRRVMESGEA